MYTFDQKKKECEFNKIKYKYTKINQQYWNYL